MADKGFSLRFRVGGDMRLLAALFKNFREDLRKSADMAMNAVALHYAVEIKKGIRSQSPAGIAFRALAASTIARKGSSSALIDQGDLIGSITTRKAKPGVYFVGLLRNALNRDGTSLTNIGPVHEFGTKDFRIPARPFIRPILESRAIRVKMNAMLEKTVRAAMRKKGWKV